MTCCVPETRITFSIVVTAVSEYTTVGSGNTLVLSAPTPVSLSVKGKADAWQYDKSDNERGGHLLCSRPTFIVCPSRCIAPVALDR